MVVNLGFRRIGGSPLIFEDFVSFIELSILKHAHLVVTVSEVLQRDLISKGIDDARIAVCANGVDVTRFMPGVISSDARADLKHKLGFEPDDIVFTFAGSFGAWHGAGLIADTINSLIDEPESSISAKCKFLMIGSGVEFSSVQMSLQDAIDQDRVVMTGLVDQNEVPAFLEISDVCLVPTLANKDGSEFFGSPTKLFEYMAAGKPVIASAVGQVKDIMETSLQAAQLLDGSGNESLSVADVNEAIGVSIAVGDGKQLKTAILFLAASKDARLAMGKNGRRAAEQKHTWKQHVSRFIDVFDNIIAIERARPLRILLNALHAKSGGGVTYLQNMLPLLGRLRDWRYMYSWTAHRWGFLMRN